MIESQTMQDTVLLAPQAVTNGATVTAVLDCKGANYASIRLLFAAELNTNAVGPTISLLSSDDTVVSNFATVVADQAAIDLTASKELRYEVDLRAQKRYMRLTVTPATATNDTVTVAAVASLGLLQVDPASTSEMQSSTNDTVVIV